MTSPLKAETMCSMQFNGFNNSLNGRCGTDENFGRTTCDGVGLIDQWRIQGGGGARGTK